MLLPEDSPAKTFQQLGLERELLMEKEVPYGGKCYDLLASYDQNTQSLKMSQACLLENLDDGLPSYCQTWPPSGMMQNGIVYRLPTLGRATAASVSGLLPTPVKSDGHSPSLKGTLRSDETWEMFCSITQTLKALYHGLKEREKNTKVCVVNPSVTEKMMGYLIGWTELPDAETQ